MLAGVLALLMRVQLAVPENGLVGPTLYNQLFTMHGTVMMFLFAVPVVEAMGILLLPNMLGARDMPFPRLSAYAFWAYAIGGLTFFCSLFFGLAPTGGWFMNPPLTTATYSPGINEDFWLLGIGFIEISAIAGAVEIIVGVLRTRAPGMTLEPHADLRVGDADLRADDRVRVPRGDPRDRVARARARVPAGRSSPRRRAAIRCCGSTCSGSSATRRSTSSSFPPPAWCR